MKTVLSTKLYLLQVDIEVQLLHCIRNIICHIYFLVMNCQNSSFNTRIIADERPEGNMLQHEEKRHVTLEAFRKLAMFYIRSGYAASQYLTNTIFIILC